MKDFIYINGQKYRVITINRLNNGVNEPYDIYELVEDC
jgi:hypothetical protein